MDVINSNKYWNERFNQNWETYQGPEQSQFFAKVAIENLPEWLMRTMQREDLTLVDWGCAQGDGTDIWCSYINPKNIYGVDFSDIAIKQAIDKYPSLNFQCADWLKHGDSKSYDIVFSSNTLEHFHDPYEVLGQLKDHAVKALILAIPYRENDRINEHFFSFYPSNIPQYVDDFQLVWTKIVDCNKYSNTFWAGEQAIIIYADPVWLKKLNLKLQNIRIEHVDVSYTVECLENNLQDISLKIDILGDELKKTTDNYMTCMSQKDQLEEKLKNIQMVITDIHAKNAEQLENCYRKIADLSEVNEKRNQYIRYLESSKSWLITSPLRKLYSCFKK